MNAKIILLTLVLSVLMSNTAYGQDCDCNKNFEWVKKTFEENDAGFQYIIDKKGQAAYHIHNQLISEKIKSAKTLTECTELLDEWLEFFRKGHIGVMSLIDETPVSQTINTPEVYNVDIPLFEKYISKKNEADYEGVWQTGSYKIGIKKENADYIGFIIESGVEEWKPKQVKMKLEQDNDKMKSTFFMRDYSPVEAEPKLLGNNYLQIGNSILKRLNSIFPGDPFIENYLKAIHAEDPYLEELNATTLYLRIPSFELEYKSAIDKVIADNRNKILKTENLIIDLRDNSGGSDGSFAELLPFLYTNPVREIGLEYLVSNLNNQYFLDISTATNYLGLYDVDEEMRQWAKSASEKMQKARLGEFVNIDSVDISINRQDVIYEYPKNVGVIINQVCASSTEQFLLAAMQSKKVKTFGNSTSGSLDISNLNLAESPCKEFMLIYGMTRSMRIPDMTIDDIGLQPDYYLDKTIPSYKWVEYVNEILNQ